MMKSISILFLVSAFLAADYTASGQTANELLEKAIAFHDPMQKWNDYTGKVHLMTIRENGNTSGGEIIEISTRGNYYKCTRVASNAIFGIENNIIFREVDGNKNLSAEEITKYSLDDSNILRFKAWHYLHFGSIMELKNTGMVLSENVEHTKFQGNDCFAISFSYDAARAINDFYKESVWTIYINPENFSLMGLKFEGDGNDMFSVFSGIVDINGLKVPKYRTYFRSKDNSFYIADIFSDIR